jgi:exodeoxyribonuclease V beta subunit
VTLFTVTAPKNLKLTHSAVIEASAGTGKSYTIRQLVLRALEERGIAISDILVVTFTRATAAEMQQTLRNALRERIGALEKESESHDRTVRLTRLRKAMAEYDNAQVLTIHSFANAVLDQFAFEAGRPWQAQASEELAQRILDETMSEWLHVNARMLYEGVAGRRVCDAIDAVFGKLDAFVALARELARKDIYPGSDRFEATTFSPNAGEIVASWDETIRSVCEKLRNEYSDGDAFKQTVLDAVGARRLTGPKQTTLREAFDTLSRLHIGETPVDDLLSLLASMASVLPQKGISAWLENDPDELSEPLKAFIWIESIPKQVAFAALYKLVRDTASMLRKRLSEQGILTFDAMIADLRKAVEVDKQESAERRALAERLRDALRKRFPIVLFDEAQDTDPDQWRIFRSLFVHQDSEPDTTMAAGNVLYLVGDPKQSIYRFRGSDLDSYLSARGEILGNAGGQLCTLGINYRSTPQMVEAIDGLLLRHPAPLFGSAVPTTEVDVPTTAGITYQGVQPNPDGGKPYLIDSDGLKLPPVALCYLPSDMQKVGVARRAYVTWLADHILDLLTGDVRFVTPAKPETDRVQEPRRVLPNDIAILCRTGREAMACIRELRKRHVPVVYERSENVGISATAQEFLSILSALAAPQDIRVVRAAIFTWWSGVSESDQKDLSEQQTTEWQGRFQSWAGMLADGRVAAAIREIIEPEAGFWGLDGVARAPFDHLRRAADLVHLGQWLEKTMATEALTVDALPGRLKAVIDARESVPQLAEGNDDAVHVLTLHSSKGLEFPIVFMGGGVTSAITGTPPEYGIVAADSGDRTRKLVHFRRWDKFAFKRVTDDAADEDKRLLYVALTRAVSYCVVPVGQCPRLGHQPGWTTALTPVLGDVTLDGLRELASTNLSTSGELLYKVHPSQGLAAPMLAQYQQSAQTAPPERPLPETHTLFPQRQFTSFTKLTKNHAPILDAVPNPAEDEADDVQSAGPEISMAGGPSHSGNSTSHLTVAGKRLGNIVHAVFEDVLKAQAMPSQVYPVSNEQLEEFAKKRLRADGLKYNEVQDPNVDAIVNMVMGAMNSLLPCGTRLMDIRTAFAEVPFLSHRDTTFDVSAALAAGRTDVLPRGFLTGNIDAIFETPAGIWIVDWKTNHLAAYDEEHIEEAMHHHRYGLQGYLYKQAIEAAKLGPVAGVRYIFVRAFEHGTAVDGKGWVDFHVTNA